MAIMSGIEGEIEVRVKRHPGQYCDEYIKLEPNEESPNMYNERYIKAEPGIAYCVEVMLKKGFDFGKYDLVQAKLYMDNEEVSYAEFKPSPHGLDGTKTKKDLVQQIRYANVEIDGRGRGLKFVFGKMKEKDELSEETGDTEIFLPKIPFLQVHVDFFESITVTLSDDDYKKAISSWEKDCANLISEPKYLVALEKLDRTKQSWQYGHCIEGVKFCPRPTEFFQNENIAKYPPFLYLYDWNALKKEDRKIAVEDL
ncbi:hypothetical protein EAE96_010868 [Botrytis aclada]|nr:hypothetical protein EAE96_010868 [Botrytis aclada]